MTTAPAAVEENAPVETPEVDPFTAAFEQMALNESDEPASGTEPKPAEPAPAPVEPVAEVVEPNPEVPAAPAEPAATPEAAVSSKEEQDALLARLAALVKEPPKEAAPAPAPAAEAAPAETPMFSADEEKFLAEYEKDWPDVAKAESLRRRAEYRQLLGYVFEQVQSHYKPYIEMVSQLSDHVQLQQLQTAVPDYNDVRTQVVDWVDKQPTYLQVAYKHVINNGTADEVTDLINRFKTETGVSPAAQAAPAPVARKQATELPPAAKQAAAALAPVSSKRTAVTAQPELSNFDDAFAAFAAKM